MGTSGPAPITARAESGSTAVAEQQPAATGLRSHVDRVGGHPAPTLPPRFAALLFSVLGSRSSAPASGTAKAPPGTPSWSEPAHSPGNRCAHRRNAPRAAQGDIDHYRYPGHLEVPHRRSAQGPGRFAAGPDSAGERSGSEAAWEALRRPMHRDRRPPPEFAGLHAVANRHLVEFGVVSTSSIAWHVAPRYGIYYSPFVIPE